VTSQPLRSRLAIVALLGALLAVPMLTTGVQAQAARQLTGPTLAPLSFPADPDGLPAPARWGKELDPAAGYQPQLACTAKPSRGIVKLRRLALDTYGRGGLSPAYARSCAYGGTSEHKDGRAWDWMLDVGNRADTPATHPPLPGARAAPTEFDPAIRLARQQRRVRRHRPAAARDSAERLLRQGDSHRRPGLPEPA